MNRNLVDAAKEFGLSTDGLSSRRIGESEDSMGVWNGDEFVFTESATTSFWWDVAKLVWRYGLAPIRTQRLMKATVGKFLRMYDGPVFPWKSLSDVAYEMGITEATAATGAEFLKANGISESFSRDIIQASTRVNYGQNLGLIHGLETMVCMAIEGAMSVDGGNWQIFSSMLSASKADVRLKEEVISLQQNTDGTTTVVSRGLGETSSSENTFDEVVIAGPYQTTQLSIEPALDRVPDEIPYVELHVTLFTSPYYLSSKYFNLPDDKKAPETILTTLPQGASPGADPKGVGKPGFWSISTLRTEILPTKENGAYQLNYLYKIFSPAPVTPEFLGSVLDFDASSAKDLSDLKGKEITWLHEKVWHSYPYMYPRVTFEDIKLADGLWYTSGIESFISTMETSSLAGMNVARLIADEWANASSAVDERGKIEL